MTSRLNPFPATIKERSLLSKKGSTQETYHLSLDLTGSELGFKVGDSFGIYAQNDPREVQTLLSILGDSPGLEHFLTHKANLSRITSDMMRLVHTHETDHDKKNHLWHLLQPESSSLLAAYLQENEPKDLLLAYTRPPLQEMRSLFAPLLPRFYSAASSPLAQPNQVDLTVAVSSYQLKGSPRYGIASHFLCHLAELETTPIPLYVQPTAHFTLPRDSSAPLIMVGPGTGVAPFRAFMQERIVAGATGKNWLFFGNRNKETDFYYEEFWQELHSRNLLRLSLAFSRDQKDKDYVHHRMLEHAPEIYAWLQEGGYFFVCGDAEKMAKDVERALLQILSSQGGLSEDGGRDALKALRKQRRYIQDIY